MTDPHWSVDSKQTYLDLAAFALHATQPGLVMRLSWRHIRGRRHDVMEACQQRRILAVMVDA